MVTDREIGPPSPVHVSVYVFEPIESGVTDSLPLADRPPVHRSDATHDVTFVVLQPHVDDCPTVRFSGLQLKLRVGGGGGGGGGGGPVTVNLQHVRGSTID